MSPKGHSVKFTYEVYLLFPNDTRRYELIDGDRYITRASPTKHQRVSGNLLLLLSIHLKKNKSAEIFAAPLDVVLSEFDVVQPDLLFISASRASIITEKNIQGAPDLIIEIISESTRKTDEIIKRKLYERYGVSEYWIVDPELETVKVYRMIEQGYVRTAEHSKENPDTLTTPFFPGLQIPLSGIFE